MNACARPGCKGTIDEWGFCDDCGHKAKSASPPPAPVVPTAAPASVPASVPSTAPGQTAPSRPTSVPWRRSGVVLPSLPPRDPATETSAVVVVPETRRHCRRCNEPVGRGAAGEPGPTEGECPKDGARFSFTPGLTKGEQVADRYEIVRCLAYGGQGWVYLARDTHLSDADTVHWVVLKGLIDTDDPSALDQAINERRHLLKVKHPNVVKINDFVTHRDARSGRLDGYIVMEYVDGPSLQELFLEHRDHRGQRAPLPLTHVLAYAMDVVQALGHLHSLGLLYCDFKPDNALYAGGEVKLIDLGAAVRADDPGDTLLATPGFAAPELREKGPSVQSDLYTVGRTLAVLSIEFHGFTREENWYALPSRTVTPLFTAHEAYYRLLRRATHIDPGKRFSSAEEMYGQLEGVLHEVLAAQDGTARQPVSTRFSIERRTFGTESTEDDEIDWTRTPDALPSPLVDPRDPAAAHLASITASTPDDLITALEAIPVESDEVKLQLVAVRIAHGQLEQARADLAELAEAAPGDWRLAWYRGILAMAAGQPRDAVAEFDAVFDAVPGELSPKLALAAAAEAFGDDERAGELYRLVWRTDTRYVSAAFGLARVLRRQGDLAAAVEALDGVPESSSQHVPAQVAAIHARLSPDAAKPHLLDASARLERLRMGIEQQADLSVRVLEAALDWVTASAETGHTGEVLGRPLEERELRFGLEQAYRDLASVTDAASRRIELVREANRVRPRTLF
ncbi:putative serine/threonine-protein kinase [Lentzea pudingi]|uniref:non-specific serine/threonine protein kinase n=1 Tax=Lentzea pudingi TaxID=1789439 RepID=A0ABQ2HQD8_9PSEU|nr:serine/threonine-protein kinase [Lentzea pudingi]GGM88595.1 putative serine/threonine-protein kinase [Lentzea pudingi]